MYILERSPGILSRFGEPPAPSSPALLPDLIVDDFDFDRADLKKSHTDKIDQFAQLIVDSWKPASTRPALGVRAVGHTDKVGDVDYNKDLGRRRAEKVLGRLTGLIMGGDIDVYQRMTWSRESKGKAELKYSNPAKNRRVEIFIQWGSVKPPPPPPSPLQAEREEYRKEKERFEAAKKEHEKRLAASLEVFKRAGMTATTRVGKATASLIQAALERSPALRPYTAQKLGKIKIPNNFKHHDFPQTFEHELTKAQKTGAPGTNKAVATTPAFYHRPSDTIHLRPDANMGHALHEGIHKVSSPGFLSVFGEFLYEGVTQYFTDVVLVEQGLGKMTTHRYQDELRCANQLIGLFTPDIIARAYFQGVGLQDVANNLARRLNSNLDELTKKLARDSTLCQRIGKLPRPQPSGAARSQPLGYTVGAVPRGAFFGEAPTISKAGADRVNLVAKKMTHGLQLAAAALPFLKTAAQKELLQLMIDGLGTFFPTGFGILNDKGEAVKGPARLRFETNIRQPGGAITRPYLYDVRLSVSDQDSPFASGDHLSIGDRASRIHLYARQISAARPQEIMDVGIHEMAHMLRALVKSFTGKFGAAASSEFPSRGTAPLLIFSRFADQRAKMEGHFARLIAVLAKQANARFPEDTAAVIAGLLLEEVLAFVFTARVGEARAAADAAKMAKTTGGPGVGISFGFVPTAFLKSYIRRHWLRDPALRTALETTETQRAIADMSDDLRALVSAMETQVGP